MCNNFIKIFDEQVAAMLIAGGFSYVTEKINGNQKVYVFENSYELFQLLDKAIAENNFQDKSYFFGNSLNF